MNCGKSEKPRSKGGVKGEEGQVAAGQRLGGFLRSEVLTNDISDFVSWRLQLVRQKYASHNFRLVKSLISLVSSLSCRRSQSL